MTPSEARATLETTFQAGWGNRTPIAWGNTSPAMPDTSWVRFTIIHGSSHIRSWSGSMLNVDRRGICFIQIFVPLGSGTRAASDHAYTAMTILEQKDFGVLTTGPGSILEVGQGDEATDQTQVRIPFHYDEQRAA